MMSRQIVYANNRYLYSDKYLIFFRSHTGINWWYLNTFIMRHRACMFVEKKKSENSLCLVYIRVVLMIKRKRSSICDVNVSNQKVQWLLTLNEVKIILKSYNTYESVSQLNHIILNRTKPVIKIPSNIILTFPSFCLLPFESET